MANRQDILCTFSLMLSSLGLLRSDCVVIMIHKPTHKGTLIVTIKVVFVSLNI